MNGASYRSMSTIQSDALLVNAILFRFTTVEVLRPDSTLLAMPALSFGCNAADVRLMSVPFATAGSGSHQAPTLEYDFLHMITEACNVNRSTVSHPSPNHSIFDCTDKTVAFAFRVTIVMLCKTAHEAQWRKLPVSLEQAQPLLLLNRLMVDSKPYAMARCVLSHMVGIQYCNKQASRTNAEPKKNVLRTTTKEYSLCLAWFHVFFSTH